MLSADIPHELAKKKTTASGLPSNMPSSALTARMVSHIFGLDVRSLSVYRMGLASTMFYKHP